MAFLSVFWAYLHASLSPAVELGSHASLGVTALDAFALHFLNTINLTFSGGFLLMHITLIANETEKVH